MKATKKDLEKALRDSHEALEDLLTLYAEEWYEKEHVEEIKEKVAANGGTIAYIADVMERNRKLLG